MIVIRENYPQVIILDNRENPGYTTGNDIAIWYALKVILICLASKQ